MEMSGLAPNFINLVQDPLCREEKEILLPPPSSEGNFFSDTSKNALELNIKIIFFFWGWKIETFVKLGWEWDHISTSPT